LLSPERYKQEDVQQDRTDRRCAAGGSEALPLISKTLEIIFNASVGPMNKWVFFPIVESTFQSVLISHCCQIICKGLEGESVNTFPLFLKVVDHQREMAKPFGIGYRFVSRKIISKSPCKVHFYEKN
jgi:hypothetical protein